MQGWAFSTVAPIVQVEVFLDGLSLGLARYGLDRPDVLKAYPRPEAAKSGYTARFILDYSLAGRKTLLVQVKDELGHTHSYPRPILVQPPAARLEIASPLPDSQSAGVIQLEGWAYNPNARVTKIEAFLDGLSLGLVPCGLYSPQVKARYGSPEAAYAGFRRSLIFPVGKARPATLLLKATDTSGATSEAEVRLELTLLAEPLAEIERATWQGDRLEVAGWAIWPISDPPRLAKFFLNSHFIGQTRVNLSRPDLSQRYPGYSAAYDCGFHFVQTLPKDTPPDGRLLVEFSDNSGHQFSRSMPLTCTPAPPILAAFAKILADYSNRKRRDPLILDWDSGLKLAELFAEYTIFSPPEIGLAARPEETGAKLQSRESLLPYLDNNLDLVVISNAEAARLKEARRVAEAGVIVVRADGDLEIAWQDPEVEVGEIGWPTISIIIPVYNKVSYTEACLKQLRLTLPATFQGEIVVIDDASRDETPAILGSLAWQDTRLKILTNPQNLGFIGSCNRGAAAAKGEILVFLNNDTLPQSGWLPPLLQTLQNWPHAGAVGGKLVYPDGILQEAGSVIFSDGTGCNFGRGDALVNRPLYNYVREVDYCSGALLATPRALFLELGGFDSRYQPAYYEDTDYCFKLREKGWRVYYQPQSTIIHFESASYGKDVATGAKSYQLNNRAKFVERWAEVLKQQPAPPLRLDYATLCALAVRAQTGEASVNAD